MNTGKQERLAKIQAEIRESCKIAGRDPNSVCLVAVSKTKPWQDISDFLALGQKDFGENYVQEALEKIQCGRDAGQNPNWHFIGSLQSNKAKLIPGNFSLFHSLDSINLAQKLNKAAKEKTLVQKCLVQVNVDAEESKSGIAPQELLSFLEKLNSLAHLEILGLMSIPDPSQASPRAPFSKVRALLEQANASSAYRFPLRELSMGMSSDFSAAILEGASIIRVGTSLFGPRQ